MNTQAPDTFTTAQIINMDESPTGDAIVSAIKGDLRSLAQKHVATPDGDWPKSREDRAYERIMKKTGRDLLAEVLNSEAMRVIDAVMACDHAECASVWGADTDYETPSIELTSAAENLSDYTCDVVQTQMGG